MDENLQIHVTLRVISTTLIGSAGTNSMPLKKAVLKALLVFSVSQPRLLLSAAHHDVRVMPQSMLCLG